MLRIDRLMAPYPLRTIAAGAVVAALSRYRGDLPGCGAWGLALSLIRSRTRLLLSAGVSLFLFRPFVRPRIVRRCTVPSSRPSCRQGAPEWRYGSLSWSPWRRASASRRARTRPHHPAEFTPAVRPNDVPGRIRPSRSGFGPAGGVPWGTGPGLEGDAGADNTRHSGD